MVVLTGQRVWQRLEDIYAAAVYMNIFAAAKTALVACVCVCTVPLHFTHFALHALEICSD